jgi:hypothetical protein
MKRLIKIAALRSYDWILDTAREIQYQSRKLRYRIGLD